MTKLVACAALALSLSCGTAFAQSATQPVKPETPGKKIDPINKKHKDKELKAEKKMEKLVVGSEAPELKIDKWVKGDEVASFQEGKVYVVEFWATWCGPCKESIPHLTELQKKFKDVTFIGVAAAERKPASGEDTRLSKLEKFVKDKGDTMGYTVAYDSTGKTDTKWMTASGQDGIPCAFVVGADRKIAWIGHPQEDLEKQVEKALKKADHAAKDTKEKKDVKPAGR